MGITNIFLKIPLYFLLICVSTNIDAQCALGSDTTSVEIDGGRIYLNNFGSLGTTKGFQSSFGPGDIIVQDFLGGIWLAGKSDWGLVEEC